MKTRILLLLFSLSTLVSCEVKFNNLFITRFKTNKIVINLYNSKDTKERSRELTSFIPEKVYEVTSDAQFTSFDVLLKNCLKTGYCCCPEATYSISFYDNNEVLDIFYADTIQFKNKVRIYEGSFQYSYLIEKDKWRNFLKEIELKK
jgi:hypothetical protein